MKKKSVIVRFDVGSNLLAEKIWRKNSIKFSDKEINFLSIEKILSEFRYYLLKHNSDINKDFNPVYLRKLIYQLEKQQKKYRR
jgi:hypothetical protein